MESPLAMILFRMYLLVRGAVETTIDVTSKAVNGAMSAFDPRIYYFLYGYATPFKSSEVNIYASTAAPVEYQYNADLKHFNDLSEHSITRYLPLLSLEIVRDGHAVYDLTEFIESMTVTSDVTDFRFPSVSQIVSAWSIGSQIVLDKNIAFVVHCMSDAGESYEFDISDTVDIDRAITEADAVVAAADASAKVVAAEAKAAEAEAKAVEAEAKAVEAEAKAAAEADAQVANVVANAVTQVVAQALADAISQASDAAASDAAASDASETPVSEVPA
jgi:hypothetical protein